MELLVAPFSPEHVENINEWQKNDYTHELTCPECSDMLIAEQEGLKCDCGYTRKSVPKFVALFNGIDNIDLPVEEYEETEDY